VFLRVRTCTQAFEGTFPTPLPPDSVSFRGVRPTPSRQAFDRYEVVFGGVVVREFVKEVTTLSLEDRRGARPQLAVVSPNSRNPRSFCERSCCARSNRSRSSDKSSDSTAVPSVSWAYFKMPTSIPTHRSGSVGFSGVSLSPTVNEANHSPVDSFLIVISLTVSASGIARCLMGNIRKFRQRQYGLAVLTIELEARLYVGETTEILGAFQLRLPTL